MKYNYIKGRNRINMKKKAYFCILMAFVLHFVASQFFAQSIHPQTLFLEDYNQIDQYKNRSEYSFTYDINGGDGLVVQDTSGSGGLEFYTSVNNYRMGTEYHYELNAPAGMGFVDVIISQRSMANTDRDGATYGRTTCYLSGDNWVSSIGGEVSPEQSGEWVTLRMMLPLMMELPH